MAVAEARAGGQQRKIAFIGSGGAVRGIAHLGVLQACYDLGLRFDMFVGASVGAVVGVALAQGLGIDTLIDSFRLPWRRKFRGPRLHPSVLFGLPTARDLMDPFRFVSGIFSMDAMERHLRRTLPINDFRKLPVPALVTAVDVDSAERKVFGPGYDEDVPISQAVAASCCVPGLCRPYRIGTSYYLDGEVVRTLSADLAIAAGAEVIVISNVYKPEVTPLSMRSLATRGPSKVLNQSVSIVLSNKESMGVRLQSRMHPHLSFVVIEPDIGRFNYLNSYAAGALLMRGYRAAVISLTKALASGVLHRAGEANE